VRARWLGWVGPLALVLAVGAVYWGSDRNLRLRDDNEVVWGNPAVTGASAVPALLGRFYNSETEFHPAVRPLATLFHRWELGLFHQNRGGFQFVELLLHALVGILLFRFLALSLRSFPLALIGSLFFTVHPALTSSVLRLPGISEVLALAFLLLSLMAALSVLREREGQEVPWPRLIACWVLFLLAALSKETVLLLVPVAWLWTWAYSRSRAGEVPAVEQSDRGDETGPSTVAWVAVGITMVAVLVVILRTSSIAALPDHVRTTPDITPDSGETPIHRAVLGLASVVTYLRLIFFPLKLGYTYDFLSGLSGVGLLIRAIVGGVLLLGLAFAAVLAALGGRPRAAFWTGGTCAFLFGGLGIVAPIGDYASPRMLYFILPMVVGTLLVGYVHLRDRRGWALWDAIAFPAALLVIGAMGVRAAVRAGDFRDQERLIRAEIDAFPQSAQAYYDLGNLYLTKELWAPARLNYEKAVSNREDDWLAWINLGAAYFGEDERGLAMRCYDRALQGIDGRAAFTSAEAKALYNKALVLMQQNRNREASEALLRTIEVFPDHLQAHANLGFIFSNSPEYDEQAKYHLKRALELETNPKRASVLRQRLDDIKKRRAGIEAKKKLEEETGVKEPH
jgi:tetratricopeptide (TPR) repeat protein